MPIRVKNVAQGFYNATGFHPIRSSWDYDPDRAGDMHSEGTGRRKKKAKAKPKAKKRAAPKRKVAKRKTTAERKLITRALLERAGYVSKKRPKGAGKGFGRKVMKISNPIPAKFTSAKVRRLPSGDIQVLITR
jgi:hypothetical protein